MSLWRQLLPLLRCPDDGTALEPSGPDLECRRCRRVFPVHAENLVELMPRGTALDDDGSDYAEAYARERVTPFTWRPRSVAWGAPEHFSPLWVERKHRQVRAVRRMLGQEREIFCDFSAGAGYYTLAFAREWDFVLHCDLSVDGVNYAHRKAERLGIRNVLFVRMDYLRPPFRETLPRVVCLDSLIRGDQHERVLLRAIRGSLSAAGAAVVDFHNWWHNPLRRIGLLRNNFGANRSYGKRELERLFADAGIAGPNCVPFHQETAPNPALQRTLERVLPPTRWMYRFQGGGACAGR